MISKISAGVSISVEVVFQPDYSNAFANEFMFAYHIAVQNHNSFTIKLLSRHWFIFDSNGEYREVQGEGVVGLQPFIEQRQVFKYASGCNLKTEMGKMHGYYIMENQDTKQTFKVQIPPFEMIATSKYN